MPAVSGITLGGGFVQTVGRRRIGGPFDGYAVAAGQAFGAVVGPGRGP